MLNSQRYTQSQHAQTLTQQSLSHARTELTSLQRTTKRQSLQLTLGAGSEERLTEMEKGYEDAKQEAAVENKRAKDEMRKRVRAEAENRSAARYPRSTKLMFQRNWRSRSSCRGGRLRVFGKPERETLKTY